MRLFVFCFNLSSSCDIGESPAGVLLLFHFWVVNSFLYFPWLLSPSLHLCFISLCVAPVALAIVFMPGLYPTAYRATFLAFFMRLALVCFYCLSVFVYVLYFIATMSFAGYFLSVLFCLLSMLISDSRFDLVWFRLSCDHGWIRSGSVNVRKQQQQQHQMLLRLSLLAHGPWCFFTVYEKYTAPGCVVP